METGRRSSTTVCIGTKKMQIKKIHSRQEGPVTHCTALWIASLPSKIPSMVKTLHYQQKDRSDTCCPALFFVSCSCCCPTKRQTYIDQTIINQYRAVLVRSHSKIKTSTKSSCQEIGPDGTAWCVGFVWFMDTFYTASTATRSVCSTTRIASDAPHVEKQKTNFNRLLSKMAEIYP